MYSVISGKKRRREEVDVEVDVEVEVDVAGDRSYSRPGLSSPAGLKKFSLNFHSCLAPLCALSTQLEFCPKCVSVYRGASPHAPKRV